MLVNKSLEMQIAKLKKLFFLLDILSKIITI